MADNACAKCRDCFHPHFGPDTDGEPCDWCRDCGCAKADHEALDSTPTERKARVMFPKSVGNATVALEDITEREAGDVGEVVAEHIWSDEFGCDCGSSVKCIDWPAHVAAALAPLIAERERAAGARALREAADALQLIRDEGAKSDEDEVAVVPWWWLRDRAAAMAPENAQDAL